jgi:hypothetical protein
VEFGNLDWDWNLPLLGQLARFTALVAVRAQKTRENQGKTREKTRSFTRTHATPGGTAATPRQGKGKNLKQTLNL